MCSSLDCGDICGGLRTFVMCDRVRNLWMRVRLRMVSVRFVTVRLRTNYKDYSLYYIHVPLVLQWL